MVSIEARFEGPSIPAVLRHQAFHIDWFLFVLCLAFILSFNRKTGHAVKVVVMVFARPADDEVFLFIDQVLPFVLAHFEISGELDRIGRAGFFAVSTEYAA